MDMKSRLLQWVNEDAKTLIEERRAPAVPIHLLLVKVALLRKSESEAQFPSASTELSLQIFERSQVFRFLRDLVAEGSLQFVDHNGEPLTIDPREMNDFSEGDAGRIKFVTIPSSV